MRSKNVIWKHFKVITEKTGNQLYHPEVCCVYCEDQSKENDNEIQLFEGRVCNLERYLKKCQHYKNSEDTEEEKEKKQKIVVYIHLVVVFVALLRILRFICAAPEIIQEKETPHY